MIANGSSLVALSPVEGMIPEKRRQHGVSYGLAEVGYDIRIRQAVTFEQGITGEMTVALVDAERNLSEHNAGRFCIASTVDRFTMPDGLAGVVHDKSTWAPAVNLAKRDLTDEEFVALCSNVMTWLGERIARVERLSQVPEAAE